MRINTRTFLVVLLISGAFVSAVRGDDDLTLKHSHWKVHARATPKSKKAGALPFDEELIFKKGILTTPSLQAQGFGPASYHSGGIETFLKWDCAQQSTTGEKITWDGIANRQRQRAWKIEGSVTRTFPDGHLYKYIFRGTGEPLSTDPLEAR